jgi:hypothetical protein
VVQYIKYEPQLVGEAGMKSITIHKLDDALAEGIEARAREKGESLNVTIKKLLAQALNISSGENQSGKKGYHRFLGTWNEEEAARFDLTVKEFENIDPGDWQ